VNAMEGRTREALHQVADGLIVSEHDLDRMEGNLMTLLDSRPTEEHAPPRRRKDWAVAAAAAVALVVSGVALWQATNDSPQNQPASRLTPQPSQPLVQPGIVGLWQNQPDSPWLWEITADGQILWTETASGYLYGGKNAIIKRDGDIYTVVRHDQAGCTQLFRANVQGANNATLTTTTGGTCIETSGEVLSLERVSPRDPSSTPLKARFPTEVSRPVTEETQLEGSWVNAETNRVLMVGQPSGNGGRAYGLDDDGDGSVRPDQRGVLTVGADGSVRPQPETGGAGGCAPAFSKVVSNTATLVTTSGANGCFPAGSRQTWLRLN
jgi:hypothetical protein